MDALRLRGGTIGNGCYDVSAKDVVADVGGGDRCGDGGACTAGVQSDERYPRLQRVTGRGASLCAVGSKQVGYACGRNQPSPCEQCCGRRSVLLLILLCYNVLYL